MFFHEGVKVCHLKNDESSAEMNIWQRAIVLQLVNLTHAAR